MFLKLFWFEILQRVDINYDNSTITPSQVSYIVL